MMDERDMGYVRMHRRLLDWEWFGDSNCVHVLVYLTLRANWQAKRWLGHDIGPGQLVTSRETIAEACGMSEKQVRLALDKLESGRIIKRSRAGKGQLVTLERWAEEQESASEKGRKRADNRAGRGPEEGRERAGTKEGETREAGSPNGEPYLPQKVDSKKSIDQRREEFKSACGEVIKLNPERLAEANRGEFFAYWTEASRSGRLRFEDEKYFDIGRRMDTWMRNAKGSSKPAAPLMAAPAQRDDLVVELNFGDNGK